MANIADPEVARFAAARERVLEAIARACARSVRSPADVQLVAVSKTVPPDRIRAAVSAGLTVMGENRVQEAESKVGSVSGATWHLVGRLQSNKARRAVELFDVIESVDSLELAVRLDRVAAEVGRANLPVYLQVNVDLDEAKAGFEADDLVRDLPALSALPNLRLAGLMTVGLPAGSPQEARPTFVRLRELSDSLRARSGGAVALGPGLSMGMSDDFETAVEEGATLVRVGRALFGER